MKRVQLTHGTARVDDNCSEETLKTLDKISKLAYELSDKTLGISDVRQSAIEWFNNLAPLRKTEVCDMYPDIIGTARRWETLTGREIEKIYVDIHSA